MSRFVFEEVKAYCKDQPDSDQLITVINCNHHKLEINSLHHEKEVGIKVVTTFNTDRRTEENAKRLR